MPNRDEQTRQAANAQRLCFAAIAAILIAFASRTAPAHQPPVSPSAIALTSLDSWSPMASEGVELKISRDPAFPTALRLEYDFQRGSGYAIARLALPAKGSLPYAENFRIDLRVRGETPDRGAITGNTLEFKLIDAANENVWWVNRPRFTFPAGNASEPWANLTFRRRHFSFAWGPSGGKPLDEVAFIEFVITAGAGGATKGTVWLDGVRFQETEPERPYQGIPRFTATSRISPNAEGAAKPEPVWTAPTDLAATAPNAKLALNWRSGRLDNGEIDRAPTLTIDFGTERSFGGLVIDWADDALSDLNRQASTAIRYEVQFSGDGQTWAAAKIVENSGGGTDVLQLPESTTRYVRIASAPDLETIATFPVGVDSIQVLPLEFGTSPNEVFRLLARTHPRGHFPLYLLDHASYWTVVGVDGDPREALIGEFGAVEIDKASFSLEPFVYNAQANPGAAQPGQLSSWLSAEQSPDLVEHRLSEDFLPIPSVSCPASSLELTTTAWAYPDPAKPGEVITAIRYDLANRQSTPFSGKLFVAIRPLQVNPIYQFLNTPGGFAPIHSISKSEQGIRVNDRLVVPITRPTNFGATTLTSGDIVEHLARGVVPPLPTIADADGLASGALEYPLEIEPGRIETVFVALPSSASPQSLKFLGGPPRHDARTLRESHTSTIESWSTRLGRASMAPPKGAEHLWDVARSQLAYILVNRDHTAIQPGSRSYERTWIRDGSLTCNAMLDFGLHNEVRDFLDWFAPYQYSNGKVPCCVDGRGPDPVPEHDSHGQFIYALNAYAQYTGDRAILERHYDRVKAAVGYMQLLRSQRLTPQYTQAPDGSMERGMAGVLPESISHEGYSAKPMHSYWDSLFNLRGLKDAATIAQTLGHDEDAATFTVYAAEARASLVESYRQTMRRTGIDYLPGCVELGDFDATSTTVALFPVNELGTLPEPALHNTFERYWKFFTDRRDGKLPQPWDAYTPYEVRTIGAFVRLGWRDRANELIEYFLNDQRPLGWNAFSEVVYRDRAKPGFVGDIPHTWCGSDFVNSFRSIFVYKREDEAAKSSELVLLHGVTRAWMDEPSGFSLSNWSTAFGGISVAVSHPDAKTISVKVSSAQSPDLRPFSLPGGGVLLLPPDSAKLTEITVNGQAASVDPQGGLRLKTLPSEVRWTYSDAPVPAVAPATDPTDD